MNTLLRSTAALVVATVASDCHLITGMDNGAKPITTTAAAQSLFSLLKSSGAAVDRQVASTFNGTTSVSGSAGTASVSGQKSNTRTSSSSSTTTTTQSDLQISFAGYRSSALTVTGKMRWFDYYYGRTACSSSACASSSSHSEAVSGTSIHVEFSYNGESYADTITIDADSPGDVSSWSVKITTQAGQVFTFTAY